MQCHAACMVHSKMFGMWHFYKTYFFTLLKLINKMTLDNMPIDVMTCCQYGAFRNVTYVMWHFHKYCFVSFLMSANKNDFKQDAYGRNAMLPVWCILKCLACGIFRKHTLLPFNANNQNDTYRCKVMLPVWCIQKC